jgi:putative transposase
MARARREWVDGGVYHLFSRGSNRQPIFLNQGDYFDFSGVFARAVERHHVECYAWSWMPNHWHLVARSPEEGLSQFVKELNHRYAIRFNQRWERTAHVFTNRFGSVLQTTQEQFLATIRYVVRNPVAAGLSPSVETASWTSFKPSVGEIPAPPFSSRGRASLELRNRGRWRS